MHISFEMALQGLGSIFFVPERLLCSVPDTHQVLLHSVAGVVRFHCARGLVALGRIR